MAIAFRLVIAPSRVVIFARGMILFSPAVVVVAVFSVFVFALYFKSDTVVE